MKCIGQGRYTSVSFVGLDAASISAVISHMGIGGPYVLDLVLHASSLMTGILSEKSENGPDQA